MFYADKIMNKRFKMSLISFALILTFVFSAASGAFSFDSVVSASDVSCNVKFSKPAICCDVGETINLSSCGVQFSATSTMKTSGITWTNNGATITTFKPTKKGVTTLVAKSGSLSKTIYVVAKNASDSEYVLYENDFSSAPTGFRVIENANGGSISTSNGEYILNASGNAEAYIRVLLPSFLDSFGDVIIQSNMKMSAAVDASKWSALMYRVQNSSYPYMQACIRYDATPANGLEISQRNELDAWNVVRKRSCNYFPQNQYNLVTITTKGTSTNVNINGYDMLTYANSYYAAGGIGFQTRGSKLHVDYIKVTLDGNDPKTTSNDVPFGKPAIRADIGDTIDLTSCDVQFTADSVYTKGSSITWKNNGTTIKTFTPSKSGVTELTATSGSTTKKVYVVTRNLNENEYVLYFNDFSSAPTDFRVIQQSEGASITHDASNGTYVLNASNDVNSHIRVLLPSFLDNFGDIKLEASMKETNYVNTSTWNSLMIRMQNQNFPYMQMCVRYDASQASGVEVAKRNESDAWQVFTRASTNAKASGSFNVISMAAQSNKVTCYINGASVASYDKSEYVTGAMGIQSKGLKTTIDYVKVTLGETTAEEDTKVKAAVAFTKPAIGCNAGQTVVLSECPVQFAYGANPVDGSLVTWQYNGKTITEFEPSLGLHKLTAKMSGNSLDVYIIAKRSTESSFNLYYNDFSTNPSDLRVIERSNGGTVSCSGGKYILNSSSSSEAYTRVLLPSYLDAFGDIQFEASIQLVNPTDEAKWVSMMYRVQNGDFPYMQGCLRYNANVSNGTEIACRNELNTWVIKQTAACSSYNPSVYTKFLINTYGKTSLYYLNDQLLLQEHNTPYVNGGFGFQARGVQLNIDYVKVHFSANNSLANLYIASGGYANVREVNTGLSLAPAMITEIKTFADLENICKTSPATAILPYKVVDGKGMIVLEDKTIEPTDALFMLSGVVMPAFRIEDTAAADSLAAFLKLKDLQDAFAVSKDLSLIKRAYDSWRFVRGVADFTDVTAVNAEELRRDVTEAGGRIIMLSSEYATRADVTTVQDRYGCVWLKVGSGKTASVEAINKGAYGIITPDRDVTEDCMEQYYPATTLVRRANVIGHRGIPSIAQENSVAGMQTAFSVGATMVETDIYPVADGSIIVMHDPTLDRTTNGTGNVQDYTAAQLQQFVIDHHTHLPAEPIPTMEDYFKSVKGKEGQTIVIELKAFTYQFFVDLGNLIKKYDIEDQVVLISFGMGLLEEMRDEIPSIPIGFLTLDRPLDTSNPIEAVKTALDSIQGHNSVFNPQYNGFGPDVINALAYRGVTLWPWTVNDQNQFDNLFLYSVGGITTDYSNWAGNLVEKLEVNSNGRVIATRYNGATSDVSGSVEFVVVEDSLGISYSNGVVNVPQKEAGGKASYFFRYKATTGTGKPYYVVTEVKTAVVEGSEPSSEPSSEPDGEHVFELIDNSRFTLNNSVVFGVTPNDTVATVKAQFKYPVSILNTSGFVKGDGEKVPTGSTIYLDADHTKTAVIVMRGDSNCDGNVDSSDYLKIKSYFEGGGNMSVFEILASDCNGDGSISSTDYIMLKSHFLGVEDMYSK